jgi:hypothetical protein
MLNEFAFPLHNDAKIYLETQVFFPLGHPQYIRRRHPQIDFQFPIFTTHFNPLSTYCHHFE